MPGARKTAGAEPAAGGRESVVESDSGDDTEPRKFYSSFTLPQLRAECCSVDLDASGNKAEMIDRLVSYMDEGDALGWDEDET